MTVVMVEPQSAGNIGAVARAMKNFGFMDLCLVKPQTRLDDEAYALASHARDVLERATTVGSLNEAIKGYGLVAGTTSIAGSRPANVLRSVITPELFANRVSRTRSSVALLLGRESTGLSNEELEKCDLIVSITTRSAYRTMNVASAAAVLLYQIHRVCLRREVPTDEANRQQRERVLREFERLCRAAMLPAHRRRGAFRAFRNMVSRTYLTRREASLVLGAFRRAADRAL